MNDSLTNKIREIIAGYFGIDPDRLTDESRLRDDLGADWLDRLELMIEIEDQVPSFEIALDPTGQSPCIGSTIKFFSSWKQSRCSERFPI